MIALLSGSLAAAGCSAGPDFQRPDPPVMNHYRPASGELSQAASGAIAERWWESFGSPELDALVAEALRNSPTLQAAKATLRTASARRDAQAGSIRLPKLDAGAGASRQGTNLVAMGQESDERTFNLFDSFLSAGYTLDLSGANKRRLEALAATAEQKRHQLDAAKLSLASSVTTTAIKLAELNDRLESMERRLELLKQKMEIEAARLQLGGSSRYELLRVQREVASLRAEAATLKQQRDETASQFRLLCGREPAQGKLPAFSIADFRLPEQLPMRVPSELVRQRPDMLASEAMMRAANAEYGVKVAESYPRITLDASLGSQALTLTSLFGGGSLLWSVGGSIAHTLFDGGHDAENKAAIAEFDLAAANYRQTVLEALKEVADRLAAIEADSRELSAWLDADTLLAEQYAIIVSKHRLGAASTLELLDVSLEKEVSSSALLTGRSRRLADAALLFQALGG
ncbi:efflux transporter outer membrane subunit [Chlorobaculum sp. 24CR]|uniref:efflux transporter outer membrane subunit n=1 Tax=Chlorobaculum sp. 24CR TaxID=2508878 RepID=UPI001FD69E21|nr:efflux transporter outer membrane subunit [Chlorobaculum sp. 24CR]